MPVLFHTLSLLQASTRNVYDVQFFRRLRDNISQSITRRLGDLRVNGSESVEESILAAEGAVDKLVNYDKLAGLDFFMQRTHGARRYDCVAARSFFNAKIFAA